MVAEHDRGGQEEAELATNRLPGRVAEPSSETHSSGLRRWWRRLVLRQR